MPSISPSFRGSRHHRAVLKATSSPCEPEQEMLSSNEDHVMVNSGLHALQLPSWQQSSMHLMPAAHDSIHWNLCCLHPAASLL